MNRSDVEDKLLDLIAQSDLGPDLETVELYDEKMVSKSSEGDAQIQVVTPAVLLIPGSEEFKASDLYGISYDDQDYYCSLMIAATNYRSAEARRHGGEGDIGVNEIMERLRDLLRGLNLTTGDRAPGEPRCFLVRADPNPDFEGMTVYDLVVRITGVLQPIQ